MGETRTYIVPDGNNGLGGNNLATMALLGNNGGMFGNGMWNNPLT